MGRFHQVLPTAETPILHGDVAVATATAQQPAPTGGGYQGPPASLCPGMSFRGL